MPQVPYISLEVALTVGRAVFLVVGFVLAAVALTRWRRVAERNAEHFAEQSTALLAQLAKMEESLAQAHRKLDALGEQSDGESRRVVPGSAAAPSYQIAIRMARSGATRDELMASCGLTRQEAELVLRLHAPARSARLAAAS
ncbi:MAG TPA: DUF2802 domain-containing protein [Steroidobacteraceae bacterium]|nr:DUF2802 domain-containing protein [Steroidobacteraceae bacterium]